MAEFSVLVFQSAPDSKPRILGRLKCQSGQEAQFLARTFTTTATRAEVQVTLVSASGKLTHVPLSEIYELVDDIRSAA